MTSLNGKHPTSPVIELTALCKYYQQGSETVKAVDQVTLDIKKGDCIVITGRSGSGKTTLLSLIGGLTNASAGTVTLFEQPLAELDDNHLADLRGARLGFVFQFASLIPTLTAFDNVRLPGLFTGKPISSHSARERLTWVGLADKLQNYPAQLSGGQQTRVALARALAHNPELLLADEPTGSLDVDSEREIMDLLIEINRTQKTTIVMVTHNPALAAAANHHYVMESGRLTEVSRSTEREASHEA